MSEQDKRPYDVLGKHLRYLREQQSESVAEVSGAVEIDTTELERIEAGHDRPAEEILMLLINHFNMQDQEAVQLWELAGYDKTANEERQRHEEVLQDVLGGQKSVVVVLGMDSRTMYSDHATVTANNAGIVVAFGQQNGKKHPQAVSKVGMSYEQAEFVIKQLQSAVLYGKYDQAPKQLPPGNL